MKILAIETSCDETALALVEASGGLSSPKFKIKKNLVASQINIHRPFGGVVPMLAKREHLKNLPILFGKLTAKSSKLEADLIAVTVGPGLEPALWTGITFAQELAKLWDKPLLGVSHLDGHLYSFLLAQKTANSKYQISNSKKLFPAVALIVSGGHTILLLAKDFAHFKKLGETVDDAAGEAFDKVARLLKLPYPGGPEIEKLAKRGDAQAIKFPRPMLNQKNYNFSFSGLKTSVLYYLQDCGRDTNQRMHPKIANKSEVSDRVRRFGLHSDCSDRSIADVAASFQEAVIDTLTKKTMRAAEEFKAKSIWLSGGVSANARLREVLAAESKKRKIKFIVPSFEYNTDNAAMIGVAAYMNHLRKKKYKLIAQGNLNF